MGAVEKGSEIFQTLVREGVGGLWRFLIDKLSDLKDTVMGAIQDFVVVKIVKAGITWLISALNPAAAFIKACKMIYDVVMFFVEKGSQIKEFVDSVLDSIESIVGGGVGAVAKHIENTLARILPLLLGFLASLLGLGGIGEKIKEIFDKIRAPVEKAVDFVINGALKLARPIINLAKRGAAWVKGKFEKGKAWAKDKYEGAKAKLGLGPKPDSALAAAPPSATGGGPPAHADTAVASDAVDAVAAATRGGKFDTIEEFHAAVDAVKDRFAGRGLNQLSARVSDPSTLTIEVSASAGPAAGVQRHAVDVVVQRAGGPAAPPAGAAAPPARRTIAWSDAFSGADAEKFKAKFEVQGQSTFAALSVNGETIGSVSQSDENGHAEVNLCNASWAAAIARAGEVGTPSNPARLVLAINRSPCPSCTGVLVSRISSVPAGVKGRVRFILAPTGVYEPSRPRNPEEVEAERQALAQVAKTAGSPGVRNVLKTEFDQDRITKASDLGALAAAGWDIKALSARDKPTTAGIILGEFCELLARKFGRS
jgi:hypothetical protein